MVVLLVNNSSQEVSCQINDAPAFIMQPQSREKIEVCATGRLTVSLSHIYESCYGECFNLPNMCQIVLNTTFIFENTTKNSVINISREKVHFEFLYTYDRFFCGCSDGFLVQTNHSIANLNAVLEDAKKANMDNEAQESLWGFILEGHFLQTTGLFLLFKLGFWANDWPFPWWIIMLFWGAGYLLRLLSEKFFNYVEKKHGTPKYHELIRYTSSSYIEAYYANPKRTWVAGDIEHE